MRDMYPILNTKVPHKHKYVETDKLLIQEVRDECQCKATNDIHERLRTIIRKDISIIEYNILGSNDISLIRKSMHSERRKLLPSLPKNLEGVFNFILDCNILSRYSKRKLYLCFHKRRNNYYNV